jgi:ribosomal protein S10
MALDMIGVNVVGPVPLPRKRRLINILKSPFKWKKHQELWERRTYTRLISFEADVSTTRRILDYLYRTKYEGVGLRVRRLSFEPLEKYWKNPYLHYVEVNRSERVKLLRASKAKKRLTPKILKPPMKAKIWHLSEHHVMREMTPKEDIIPKEEDFEEPDTPPEELMYNDDNFKFDVSKYGKFDDLAKDRLHRLVKLCREKLNGPKVDKATWNDISGELKGLVAAKNELKNIAENE